MKTTGLMILTLLVLSGIAFSRTCYADARSDADRYERDADRYRQERDELQSERDKLRNERDEIQDVLDGGDRKNRAWKKWNKCIQDARDSLTKTEVSCGSEPHRY